MDVQEVIDSCLSREDGYNGKLKKYGLIAFQMDILEMRREGEIDELTYKKLMEVVK